MESHFKDYLAGLSRLERAGLPIYHSVRCEREAKIVGKIAVEAYRYLQGFLEEKPEILLLILSQRDWKKRLPRTAYGEPVVPDARVHYGIKPPDRWKEMLSKLCDEAPINLKRQIASISGPNQVALKEAIDNIFTLEFFSATVAHELAHPFLAANLVLPQPVGFVHAFKLDAFWLGEFLPQYIMYSFLQATNVSLCEQWLLLMKSAFEGGKSQVRYTNLAEMGVKYREMIESHIENIFWFQAKLFVMSADLYTIYGEDFLIKAVERLKLNEKILINQLKQDFREFHTWLQNWE